MDEELRLAAQLQREFLPSQLPDVHGMQFAAMYRPAGYVSGDVYDVMRFDDGEHVGLFVADAVGHGVPAALMTVLLLEAMRAHVVHVDASAPDGSRPARPDEVLAAINRTMLAQQAGRVRTATACYALLNCRSRQVMLARAGHPPAMLLESDGRMTPLQPEGSLFGVFHDPEFEVLTFRLQAGQRLLLYSDGFEVAFRGEPGSEQSRHVANPAFAERFAMLARGPMQEALLTMAGTLDQQVGSLNQADDLTALMVGVSEDVDAPTTSEAARALAYGAKSGAKPA
jgi:phosphoserine phosphatase RsbU/P